MSTMTETLSNAGKLVRHAIGAALSPIRAGEEKIVSQQPSTAGPPTLRVTSETFLHGAPIPEKCTPAGANMSPQLNWSAPPGITREIVLICEDPDAPMMKPFVHWILHGLPPEVMALPLAVPNARELAEFGRAKQGQNDAKTRGWFGPKPPLGHGVHHYHFQLFAVNVQLGLGPDTTLEELVKRMSGHVVAEGELVGTHELKGTS
jgi:Raf kinase inhibitor-like YbhB/YbcL family protein